MFLIDTFKYNKEVEIGMAKMMNRKYMKTTKRLSKEKLILATICLSLTTFTGLIGFPFVGAVFPNTTSTLIIDLSEKFDSRIMPICERQKLGHQGGIAVGDINGDGINDLVLSAYNASINRSTIVDLPFDKYSWTESSNLSLWDTKGTYSVSISPYKVAGNNSIVGVRKHSKEAVFRIKWNNSLNLSGCLSLNMYINASGKNEKLKEVRISSINSNNGAVYKEIIDLETGNWTEINMDSNDFKKVGSPDLSNISSMFLVFSGGGKGDEIKIDNLYFKLNEMVSSRGAVYVFYGPVSGMYSTSAANVTIVGTPNSKNFGEYISVGDVNNDTYDDVIVGSPLNDFEFPSDGKVQVFFGAPQLNNLIAEDNYSIYGKNKSLLGYNIISKDINDDFVDDLILSAPYADRKNHDVSYNCGEIYMIFGSSNLSGHIDLNDSEPDITIIGKDKFDALGRQSTFGIGDIYGDGVKDLVAGVRMGDSVANSRIDAGEVYIINNIGFYDGIIDLNDINITTIVYGAEARDFLGTLTVGDFNSDGLNDLLMGAPGADSVDNSRENSGEVYIIYGRHDLTSIIDLNLSNADVRIVGADSNDCLGSVVPGGNVSDIIFGSTWGDGLYDNKTDCGEVNILFNNKNMPGLIDLQTYLSDIIVYGADPYDHLRDFYVGDVSGDNVSDLIIGLRDADGFYKKNGGEVFVINGREIELMEVER